MVKFINAKEKVTIPEGITATVNSRQLKVAGPRGVLKRNLRHAALDIHSEDKGKSIVIESWFGNKEKNASVKTIATMIENLIKGVTNGYKYKMRFVYAHFPVNVTITPDNKTIEIRNFLGEKRLRSVTMKEGVKISFTGQKDEVQIEGNDLDLVSQSAAAIHMATLVKNKDIRKFLDGIYVSEKGFISE